MARGKAFQPADIEILFWGFEYARGEPVPWPAEIPTPSVERGARGTIARRAEPSDWR